MGRFPPSLPGRAAALAVVPLGCLLGDVGLSLFLYGQLSLDPAVADRAMDAALAGQGIDAGVLDAGMRAEVLQVVRASVLGSLALVVLAHMAIYALFAMRKRFARGYVLVLTSVACLSFVLSAAAGGVAGLPGDPLASAALAAWYGWLFALAKGCRFEGGGPGGAAPARAGG